jgi:hypothetical protein
MKRLRSPIYIKCPVCKHLVLPGHLEDRDFNVKVKESISYDEFSGVEIPFLLKKAVASLGRGKGFKWKEIPYPPRVAIRVLMRVIVAYGNLLWFLDQEDYRLKEGVSNFDLGNNIGEVIRAIARKDDFSVSLTEIVEAAEDWFDEEVGR